MLGTTKGSRVVRHYGKNYVSSVLIVVNAAAAQVKHRYNLEVVCGNM